MDFSTTNQLARHFRQFQFVLRNDSESRAQFRILVLGIIACLALYYVGTTVILEPKEKKLQESRDRKAAVASMGDNRQMLELGPKIVQMQQKKKIVEEDIEILKLRAKFQREQWRSLGDPTRFNNVIFTMNTTAPINIDGKLQQMILGEKRTMEMYDEQPIMLSGKDRYDAVLSYLRYMENSPEIGSIDNLAIKAVTEKDRNDSEAVHFSMMVSKIILKDK
jgi:hypothetical protein